ncbi:MAG TPA: hypothetical protein VNY05_03975 [Candidatus Acidoferrales bacterium]|nr:hypothetical protein [Candidatus Acidoferrales bacterium]
MAACPILYTRRALVRAALEKHDTIISYQIVQEFLNLATRKPHYHMNQAEAQLYLATRCKQGLTSPLEKR